MKFTNKAIVRVLSPLLLLTMVYFLFLGVMPLAATAEQPEDPTIVNTGEELIAAIAAAKNIIILTDDIVVSGTITMTINSNVAIQSAPGNRFEIRFKDETRLWVNDSGQLILRNVHIIQDKNHYVCINEYYTNPWLFLQGNAELRAYDCTIETEATLSGSIGLITSNGDTSIHLENSTIISNQRALYGHAAGKVCSLIDSTIQCPVNALYRGLFIMQGTAGYTENATTYLADIIDFREASVARITMPSDAEYSENLFALGKIGTGISVQIFDYKIFYSLKADDFPASSAIEYVSPIEISKSDTIYAAIGYIDQTSLKTYYGPCVAIPYETDPIEPQKSIDEGDPPGVSSLKGDGSSANPYRIGTKNELLFAAGRMNRGDIIYSNTKNYELTADIDLEGENFPMIDTFRGILDGKGCTISGLKIEDFDTETTWSYRVGFIRVLSGGTVRNLAIKDATVLITGSGENNDSAAGILAGEMRNGATVSGCEISGALDGYDSIFCVGGIIGTTNITTINGVIVEDCAFKGIVRGYATTGGIIGYASGFNDSALACVERCIAMGSIEVKDAASAGGAFIAAGLGDNVSVANCVAYSGSMTYPATVQYAGRISGSDLNDLVTNLAGSTITKNGVAVAGTPTANSADGLSASIGALQSRETYKELGWDFEQKWKMDAVNGYPVLNFDNIIRGYLTVEIIVSQGLIMKGDVVEVQVEIVNGTNRSTVAELMFMIPYFAVTVNEPNDTTVRLSAGEATTFNYAYKLLEGGRESFKTELIAEGKIIASAQTGISVFGPGFYRGDNHSHTRYSDGSGSVADNAKVAYEERMLSWLYTTDHNTNAQKSATEKETELKSGKFLNLSTMEFTATNGHALLLGTPENLLPSRISFEQADAMTGGSFGNLEKWQELVDTITAPASNGIFYVAHPYDTSYGFDYRPGVHDDATLRDLRRYTGLEIWNGGYASTANSSARDAWDKVNTQGTGHYAGLAVSDAHAASAIAAAYIKAFLPELNADNIHDTLKKGTYVCSNGPEIRFDIEGVGVSGTLNIIDDNYMADFNIHVYDPGYCLTKVAIIKNTITGKYELSREVVYAKDIAGEKTNTFDETIQLEVKPGEFYRIEVQSEFGTTSSGSGYAITNNIWIEKAEESNATNLHNLQYAGSGIELKTLPTGIMYLSGSKGAVLELDKLTADVAEGATIKKSYDSDRQMLNLTLTAMDGSISSTEIFVLIGGKQVSPQGIIVNFPGLKDVTVQYYTNISQWVTVGKFDDTCNFTIPESHKATWGVTTVRIVKDGMYHTFTLDAADKALVLEAPLSAITVIGIASACNLAIVQNDWVYCYAPATVGGENEFLVFGNGKAYEIRLQKPGASIISIKGTEAGQTVDLSEHFYGDIAAYDAAHAAFCAYYDTSTWVFKKELFLDNIYRTILQAEQIMNSAGQAHADLLAKHGKLAAGRFDASDSVEAIAEGTRMLNQGIAGMMAVLR